MARMESRVKIREITRLNNSRNGNPRFAITWEDPLNGNLVTRRTASDASFNYEIGNPGLRTGDFVEITFVQSECIANMRSTRGN